MKTIQLAAIKIAPSRQRRVFDAAKLHAFAENIGASLLQNAIVLRIVGDDFQLVSGERRLRAVTDLADLGQQIRHDGQLVPLGFIPYTLFDDLDPSAAEEAELDENLKRENLSWQEESAAVARLRDLRAKQALARGDSPPTVAELTVELKDSNAGGTKELVRRQLIVANHLDDPEVRAAKSVDDAFTVLKKKEQAQKSRELGERVGRAFTAAVHTAINEDSLVHLLKFEPKSFDVILSDPPYGMNADKFGDAGGLAAGAHGYEDSEENAIRCYSTLISESFRITKDQAHLYLFCDIDNFAWIRRLVADAGWQTFRTPLLWYKKNVMRAPWPAGGPQRKYETILYARKGDRPVLKMAGDVLEFNADENLGHAAQKPVALFQELLTRSCNPGDSVLDPFCGSGPIFPAAHALKCRATGIELDTSAYGIAVKRIEALKAQGELAL